MSKCCPIFLKVFAFQLGVLLAPSNILLKYISTRYSLKGPEFHREARKNNELLRNSDRWDELLTYRERLVTATDRLRTALAECA